MSPISKNPAVLALILAFYLPIVSQTPTSTTGRDVMLTRVFVDIYDTATDGRSAVVATSDGGAAFAQYKGGNPRVVKVDSSARFEWFSESRVAGDTSSSQYYSDYMVEDTSDASNPYLFLSGHLLNSSDGYTYGFIIKYRRNDGSYVAAKSYLKSGYTFLIAQTLFVNSTADKSTLAVTEHAVTTSCSSDTYVYRIIEESDRYVFAGGCTTSLHLWVSAVLKSNWHQPWSYNIGTDGSAGYVYAIYIIAAGSYGVLCSDGYYYPVTSSGGIKTAVPFSGSTAMTIAPGDSSSVLISGFSTTSFAYVYSPSSGKWYNQGQNTELTNVHFFAASKHPSYNRVWISGYLATDPNFGFAVAVEVATPISCANTNYLNQFCYLATSSSCFGLCATCLLPGNINACSTVNSLAHADGKYLFVGRCKTAGKHFRTSTNACATVTESSACHKLCGGECIIASSASACAHHCTGSLIEPHIDDSGLANNKCGCQVGYAFNDSSQKCESCGALCGTGGCVAPGNNAKCVNCVSTATTTPVSGQSYVQCICTGNTVASGGACAACHVLCNGCTSPGDNTTCNSCVVGGNATTVQTSPPYTCDCASGYVFYMSQCLQCSLYCNGCTAPGDNTKCSACASIGNIQATGSAGAYTCKCPGNSIYVAASSACLPCHDLCNGCVVANSNSNCIACSSASLHIVASQPVAPYYTCSCDHGFAQSGTQCLPCSVFCDGCSVPADNSKCSACAAITDIQQSGSSGALTCGCAAGYSLSGTLCSSCYPLCVGCSISNSNTNCTLCSSALHVNAALTSSTYTCTCDNGSALSIDQCLACSPLCATCTEPADNTKCLTCSSITGVYQSAPNTCACPGNQVLPSGGSSCLPCSPLCSGCSVPADSTKCIACASIAGVHLSGSTTCSCQDNYVLDGGVCSACHPLCNGCTVPSNSTECLACSSADHVLSTPGSLYTCACAPGYALSGSSCLPCSPFCSTCASPLSNTACLACSPNITNVFQSPGSSTGTFTCACPAGTVLSGSACSSCHPLCDECAAPNDQTKCLACSSTAHVSSAPAAGGLYVCGCEAEYTISGATCAPCSPLCEGCISTMNNTACLACSSSIPGVVQSVGSSADTVTCDCLNGTALSGSTCSPCHPLCDSCTVANDQTKCSSCIDAPNVQESATYGLTGVYTCTCISPTNYDAAAGFCVYSSGCHPLCSNGECISQSNASACISCGEGTTQSQTQLAGMYECTCQDNTLYRNGTCDPIRQEGCHVFCSGGCVDENDSSSCVACVNQRNVVSEGVAGDVLFSCTCRLGTHISGAMCIYTSGCSPYCASGCFIQSSASACVDCVPGISPVTAADLNVTCACPAGTTYRSGGCSSDPLQCSGLCGELGCTAENDSTACVSICSNGSYVIVLSSSGSGSGIVACGCRNGSHVSASGDECIADPEEEQCADEERYLDPNGTYRCITKGSGTHAAFSVVQYAGYVSC